MHGLCVNEVITCLKIHNKGSSLLPKLVSKINPDSAEFRANRKAMEVLVSDLREKVAKIAQGGSERAREKHLGRGKLLPRERVERLLDPGTPFLELSQMAAYGMYEDQVPSAGLITGIGRVNDLRKTGAGPRNRSRK